MSFDLLALNPRLRENVRDLGYEIPTPIQRQAIPPIIDGRDVIGLAQTGTGKTAAFGLPIIQRLMEGPRRQLRVLIVCPTRELADQTADALDALGAGTDLEVTTVYGGVGMQPQVDALRHGAEIVVACPGRLLDHMQKGTVRLSRVECLVLDEADRMFDMGFLPDIRRILSALPKERQTLLFSATMPPEIRGLAHEILRDPLTLQIALSRPVETVTHALYPVNGAQKPALLLAILDRIDRESVLIFTRTKHRAKRLAQELTRSGHRATCLQGNLSQRQRREAMEGFRSGRYQVLVATDIASRGLDVSTISHVINLDVPGTVDDYTHRIGRTGRAAKTGDAFTLVSPEDEGMVRAIEKVLGSLIPRRTVEGFPYAAGGKVAAAGPHLGRPPRPQGRSLNRGRGRAAGQSPERAPRPYQGPPRERSHGNGQGGRPQGRPQSPRARARAFGDRAREARAQGSYPEATRAHESPAHEARPHGTGAHDTKSHEARPYGARAHDTKSHEARPYGARAHDTKSHEARPYGARAHDTKSHEARPYGARAHDTKSHEARPYGARAQDTKSHEARPYGARAHDAKSHEARPYGARAHDARSHEARPYGARTHDTRSHEARPYGARAHDAKSHEARPYGARAHETRSHEARPGPEPTGLAARLHRPKRARRPRKS